MDLLKTFIRVLSVCTLGSFDGLFRRGLTKCVSINNHPCHTRTTLDNTNFDEILFYSLSVSVNKCGRNCNTIDDTYLQVCVPIKWKTWM